MCGVGLSDIIDITITEIILYYRDIIHCHNKMRKCREALHAGFFFTLAQRTITPGRSNKQGVGAGEVPCTRQKKVAWPTAS